MLDRLFNLSEGPPTNNLISNTNTPSKELKRLSKLFLQSLFLPQSLVILLFLLESLLLRKKPAKMCQRPEVKKKSSTASTASTSSTASSSSVEVSVETAKALAPTHSDHKRNTEWDWLIFLGPLLFYKITPIWSIYAIAITRILVTHIVLSLHYQLVDKDNYMNKLTQKQLQREKDEYLTAFILHMYTQVALQVIFPSMFFSDASVITSCIKETILAHVVFIEPAYYFVHRWLHVPEIMKKMHGFHHLSIRTLPTTSLVQNFHEHFVYVATFGPAFFAPFLLQGRQHWVAIGVYLVSFDVINMWGHTNVRVRNPIFTHKYSPLKYLFYTPEFHLGHHAYFNANYALFMPIWDYIFGTARHYEKPAPAMLPAKQQDFVFIGHNGGLGHFLTIPELNLYNAYSQYKIYLPLRIEFLIMHAIRHFTGLFSQFYYCSRFCIANDYVGRIICLLRTPVDYMTPESYDAINQDMIKLMRKEHQKHGTRYFGLGNLNKMKQLNDGGLEMVKLVEQDEYLKDKNIKIWTGDTMTVASVYNQMMDIPNLQEFYYIGAGGKIGTAVCEKLVRDNPKLKIRIFSRNVVLEHPNISYSTDLSEMADYKIVLVGKILSNSMYSKALKGKKSIRTRYVLDYTVPAMPVAAINQRPENVQHIRIGLLKTGPNNSFLKGPYDVCMSTDENHIVPCHFGCLLNTVEGRETHEVGDIDQEQVDRMWKMTLARGFYNITIDYQ